MAFPSSAHPEETCSTALSPEELENINGGIGIALPQDPIPIRFAFLSLKIRPFSCLTYVQGVPRDLLGNSLINPVLKSPFAGL
jgi:hypothetical protein